MQRRRAIEIESRRERVASHAGLARPDLDELVHQIDEAGPRRGVGAEDGELRAILVAHADSGHDALQDRVSVLLPCALV